MIDYFYLKELKRYENTLKNNYFMSLFDDKKQDIPNKYAFQSEILQDNVPQIVKSVNKSQYEYVKRDLLVDFSYRDFLAEQFGCCKILEAYRMNESYKKRIQRLKSKIQGIFNNKEGRVYFLTFTFTDDSLNSTNEFKRRRYVREWLNKYTIDFVGNIDFGEENDREHYHALVNAKTIDSSTWYNKYGAMKWELVRYDKNSTTKLAKYINKFLNHAIKETTKRQHIIYNRKKRLNSNN